MCFGSVRARLVAEHLASIPTACGDQPHTAQSATVILVPSVYLSARSLSRTCEESSLKILWWSDHLLVPLCAPYESESYRSSDGRSEAAEIVSTVFYTAKYYFVKVNLVRTKITDDSVSFPIPILRTEATMVMLTSVIVCPKLSSRSCRRSAGDSLNECLQVDLIKGSSNQHHSWKDADSLINQFSYAQYLDRTTLLSTPFLG